MNRFVAAWLMIFTPSVHAECFSSAAEVRDAYGVKAWSTWSRNVSGHLGEKCYFVKKVNSGSTPHRSGVSVVARNRKEVNEGRRSQQISVGRIHEDAIPEIRTTESALSAAVPPSPVESDPPQRIIELLDQMGWIEYNRKLMRLVDIVKERWERENQTVFVGPDSRQSGTVSAREIQKIPIQY